MRPSNSLEPGKMRHGWLISDEHEPMSAVLSFKAQSVTLTVLSDYSEPEGRWTGQLNPQTLKMAPIDLIFVDEKGTVELVECLPRNRRGSGPGKRCEKWDFQPRFIVLGGNGRTWSTATTIESYVPMLRKWLGENARRIGWDLSREDGDKWLEIDLKSDYSFHVDGALEHQIITDSRTDSSQFGNGIHAFSATRISTNFVADHRDLALTEHTAILDFLTIVYGSRITYDTRIIKSLENPIRDINGKLIGPDFVHECELLSLQDQLNNSDGTPTHQNRALISSSDPSRVLSQWLKFWSDNRLGVKALTRAISEQSSWENKLLNTAVAFEEFGYRLPGLTEYGTIANNFPIYIKRICLDMPKLAMSRPENWARRFNLAYKGLKHADNKIPSIKEIAVTTQQGIAFLRAWCCFKVDPDTPIDNWYWNQQINYEEFYPKPTDINNSENWSALLPESVILQEFSRLERRN